MLGAVCAILSGQEELIWLYSSGQECGITTYFKEYEIFRTVTNFPPLKVKKIQGGKNNIQSEE